jgi:hypothetical protein
LADFRHVFSAKKTHPVDQAERNIVQKVSRDDSVLKNFATVAALARGEETICVLRFVHGRADELA